MTTNSSIPVSLLYNEILLRQLLCSRIGCVQIHGEEWTKERYESYAQREFQLAFRHQENEVFASRWRYFCDKYEWDGATGPVLAVLASLYSEYLEQRDRGVHVRLERFGEWQNLMANICPQPIMAYAAYETHKYSQHELGWADVCPDLLCYPYEIAVEDYIDNYGLNDAHVHINACAYGECSWLYALQNTERSFRHLVENTRNKQGLRQQFLEVYEKDAASVLQEHLQIARNLRIILRSHVLSPPSYENGRYDGGALVFLSCCSPDAPVQMLSEVELPALPGEGDWAEESQESIIRRERLWMARLVRDLKWSDHKNRLGWLCPLFHTYILLMNEYINLFTQREQQRGFEQFSNTQGLANYLNWHKRYYLECFRHFHGPRERSAVLHVDARVMPKESREKNLEQILAIVRDYDAYLKEVWENSPNRSPLLPHLDYGNHSVQDYIRNIGILSRSLRERFVRLNLTAHFIKQPWVWEEGDSYRYCSYRHMLKRSCIALSDTFSHCPGLDKLFKSIDAANDEQFIPPSVFAPSFRYCRKILQMDNITFHCGEDFPHLLTGLRVLDDAVGSLQLDCGDRIGHATALGMDPKFWRHSVPKYLYVRKETRMLDLLFALRILRKYPDKAPDIQEAAYRELFAIAHELFDVCRHVQVDFVTLQDSMALRWLSPHLLYKFFGGDEDAILCRTHDFKTDPDAWSRRWKRKAGSTFEECEIELTCKALKRVSPKAILLLMMWFTRKDIWERGRKMVEIKVEKPHDPLYLILQQHLMQQLHDRRVVVETLPTSNLRISYYSNAWEHHAMRWLCREPDVFRDDPKIFLAFGSDDPGVFTCDTKSEFYLLYSSLREHGITEQEAISLLHEVNNRGRVYSFANTNFRSRGDELWCVD